MFRKCLRILSVITMEKSVFVPSLLQDYRIHVTSADKNIVALILTAKPELLNIRDLEVDLAEHRSMPCISLGLDAPQNS